MDEWVYRRSVDMAVEILGGNQALATYLGVPQEEVGNWLEGRTQPALAFFQRMVALIETHTVSAARTATVVRSRRDENK